VLDCTDSSSRRLGSSRHCMCHLAFSLARRRAPLVVSPRAPASRCAPADTLHCTRHAAIRVVIALFAVLCARRTRHCARGRCRREPAGRRLCNCLCGSTSLETICSCILLARSAVADCCYASAQRQHPFARLHHAVDCALCEHARIVAYHRSRTRCALCRAESVVLCQFCADRRRRHCRSWLAVGRPARVERRRWRHCAEV
jgi:hypothetical protein